MLRRSSVSYVTLIIAVGLIVGRLIPIVAIKFDQRMPVPGWGASIFLGFFAVVVGAFAWTMWQQVQRDRRTISAAYGLRMLAVAKASVLVGGVFAGGYAGFALAFVTPETDGEWLRLWQSAAASGAAVLLLIAALLLERACQIPSRDDEDDVEASPA